METQIQEIISKTSKCDPISVIESLGGVNHVVKLCLTHPDSITNEKYLQNALTSIQSIIKTSQAVTTTEETKVNKFISIPATHVNTDTEMSEIIIYEDDTVTPAHNPNNGNIASLLCNHSVCQLTQPANINKQSQSTASVSMANYTDKMVVVHNKDEFNQGCIVLKANRYDNLFNKWIWLNNNQTVTGNWCTNLISMNKCFSTAVIVIIPALVDAAATIWYYVIGEDIVYYILESLVLATVINMGIFVLSSMNLMVAKIVINTFDFWFKLWNLVLWEIGYVWLAMHRTSTNKDGTILGYIVGMCIVWVIFCVLFLFDAIPMKRNIKRTITFIIVVLNTYAVVYIYFIYDDVYYNPFEVFHFNHTKISMKSLLLNSYGNLILFIAKPIFGDIYRLCLDRSASVKFISGATHHCKDKDKGKGKTTNLEKLTSVYKRSKIQWYTSS